jgi:alkylhydroperoxidase/carboxymuconolactone decarboxylase family protein YurZ
MAINQHTTTEELLEVVFSVVCAMAVATQQHIKHTSAATNPDVTMEELFEAVFSVWSVPRGYQ